MVMNYNIVTLLSLSLHLPFYHSFKEFAVTFIQIYWLFIIYKAAETAVLGLLIRAKQKNKY